MMALERRQFNFTLFVTKGLSLLKLGPKSGFVPDESAGARIPRDFNNGLLNALAFSA